MDCSRRCVFFEELFAEEAAEFAFDLFEDALFHSVAVKVAEKAVAFDFLDNVGHGELAVAHAFDAFGHFAYIKTIAEF